MATIFDYLTWRGDLTFKQSPFNPVDNIIFALLSYLPFDGIVPGPAEKKAIPLAEAANRLEASQAANPAPEQYLMFKENPLLLSALAVSERYRNLGLTGYVNHIDISREKQFAALTILNGGRSAYIAYRGTDNTLVGWKEDFNMSFSPQVPSQAEAVSYLETMANRLRARTLLAGGHSKGGNLAVYAASFCNPRVQRRIAGVYNNDGPGFHPSVLAGKGYKLIRNRIHSFIPQSSVIGMLFEHDDDYTVIKSSQTGLMQHDIYSWEVTRNDVVSLDTVTQGSLFIDRTLKEWIYGLTADQRKRFIDALYEILSATEAKSLPELTANWLKNARIMMQSFNNIEEPTKDLISQTLAALLQAAKNNLSALWPGLPDRKTRP
jgi:hypothetical protein